MSSIIEILLDEHRNIERLLHILEQELEIFDRRAQRRPGKGKGILTEQGIQALQSLLKVGLERDHKARCLAARHHTVIEGQ